jgi:hypothetical protein
MDQPVAALAGNEYDRAWAYEHVTTRQNRLAQPMPICPLIILHRISV